jgi:hypothetical protein
MWCSKTAVIRGGYLYDSVAMYCLAVASPGVTLWQDGGISKSSKI